MQAENRKQTNVNERKQLRVMMLVFIFCAIIAVLLLYLLFADLFNR